MITLEPKGLHDDITLFFKNRGNGVEAEFLEAKPSFQEKKLILIHEKNINWC